MKVRYLILLAALAYAGGLVLAMPAATALSWAPPLPLQGVEGRALAGRAEALQIAPAHRIEDLHWRLAPAQLFSGRVGALLDFSYLEGRGEGLVGIDWNRRLHVQDARLRLSAERLASVLAIPLAEFSGEIEARLDSAVWQDQTLETVDGRLVWRGAALRQPLQLSLGELEALVSRDGEQGFLARISNAGGALSIEGELRLNGRRLQTDLRLRPLAGAPTELPELLSSMARRQSDGSYRIQRSTDLRELM